jgi:hypothetical protein
MAVKKAKAKKAKSPDSAATPAAETPAAGTSTVTKSSGVGGYSVSRPGGICAVTGEPIHAGETFHAALRETPIGLERVDVKLSAWDGLSKDHLLASWVTKMPSPTEEKKKLFVDDEVLVTLFERLADTTETVKVRFRFVLGLILMRKRLVTYDSQREERGESIWTVRVRGKPQQPMDLVNPHLTEEAVGEVSAQLGEILSSEL